MLGITATISDDNSAFGVNSAAVYLCIQRNHTVQVASQCTEVWEGELLRCENVGVEALQMESEASQGEPGKDNV